MTGQPLQDDVRSTLVALVAGLQARLHDEAEAKGARWRGGAVGAAYGAVQDLLTVTDPRGEQRPAKAWLREMGLRSVADVWALLDAVLAEERLAALAMLRETFDARDGVS